MYIPSAFHVTDRARLVSFIEEYSFATLATDHAGEPFASHLPLLFEPSGETTGRLIGHMARANPQWQDADGTRVLAMFQGPHAYISPTWYSAQNAVPTWNYIAVHVYGTLRIVTDEIRLREILDRMVAVYEVNQPTPWTTKKPDAVFIERLAQAIVGFEISMDRIEGKWKLNQNHEPERRQRVIAALRESPSPDSAQIADAMEATLGDSG